MTGFDLGAFRRKPERPLVYGHRGARARAPENTLEAFDLALREGADGIELDVRMTADGQLVILHDGQLAIGGGRTLPVARLSLEQIRMAGRNMNVVIPTLDEALAWHRKTGKLTNVELKGDVPHWPWMARQAAARITAHGAEGILISSFHPGIVRTMTRLMPAVPAAFLLEAGRMGSLEHLLGGYRLLGAVGVHPERRLLTPAYFRVLQGRGALVNTWTVNDPAEAVRLADLGVDGIVTDRPLEILAALSERPDNPTR